MLVLGRYEPGMVNASVQGCIYSVPKTSMVKGAPFVRKAYAIVTLPHLLLAAHQQDFHQMQD